MTDKGHNFFILVKRMSGFRTRNTVLAILLGVVFACIYVLCSPSLEHQHWDSLSYASDCDEGNSKAIIGNHPMPHIVMHGVMATSRMFGYEGRALPLLIWFNSIVGGMVVGLLFLLLVVVCDTPRNIACGVSMLFGASAAILRYAGTADIYSMVFLTTILAWAVIGMTYRQGTCGRWIYAGIAAGMAMLFHQISAALVGVCGLLALGDSQRRWSNVANVIFGAGVTVFVGYTLSGWVATRTLQPEVLANWFMGYFQSGTYGRITNFSFVRICEGVDYFGLALLSHPWNYVGKVCRFAFLNLTPLAFFLMLACHWDRLRLRALITVAAVCHAVVGAAVVQWYEPWTEKFWMMVWLPLLIVVGLVSGQTEGTQSKLQKHINVVGYALLSAGVFVVVFNLWFRGLPQHRDTPEFTAMLATWVAHTSPEDILVTGGDGTAQLRFWAGRPYATPLDNIVRPVVGTDPFEDMRTLIRTRLDAGANVYITEGLERYAWHLSSVTGGPNPDEIRRFFATYQREPVFAYWSSIDGRRLQVFRVTESSAVTTH